MDDERIRPGETMRSEEDLVGYLERAAGLAFQDYWCESCVPPAMREPLRAVTRETADRTGATCTNCGLQLAQLPALSR